jgi:hypothetical protein
MLLCGEQTCVHHLVGRHEGGGLLGRPWHRWKDNIDVDLKQIGRVGVDWIHLAYNREHMWVIVSTVLNIWIP